MPSANLIRALYSSTTSFKLPDTGLKIPRWLLGLKEAYEKARKERKDVAIYDSKLDEAQEELEELREKADELISDVMAELRFFLRKTDDASRNRIMKRYGVEFKYLEGEPEDEEAPEAKVE